MKIKGQQEQNEDMKPEAVIEEKLQQVESNYPMTPKIGSKNK